MIANVICILSEQDRNYTGVSSFSDDIKKTHNWLNWDDPCNQIKQSIIHCPLDGQKLSRITINRSMH